MRRSLNHHAPGRRRRPGNSLLELVAAATVISTALVPALRIMGESLLVSRELDTAAFMTSVCVSKLEEQMALSAASWNLSNLSGDFAVNGRSDVRYTVTKSESVASGGIPNELMAITVTVWNDKNANGAKETGETGVTYATKIPKLQVYMDAASS